MARYQLTLMHGERGGSGNYAFEADGDLFTHSAMTILDAAMQALEAKAGLGHIGYEANAAMKNDAKAVVTALGVMIMHDNDRQPFVAFVVPMPAG